MEMIRLAYGADERTTKVSFILQQYQADPEFDDEGAGCLEAVHLLRLSSSFLGDGTTGKQSSISLVNNA